MARFIPGKGGSLLHGNASFCLGNYLFVDFRRKFSLLSGPRFGRSSFNRLYRPIRKLLASVSSAADSVVLYLRTNATQFLICLMNPNFETT